MGDIQKHVKNEKTKRVTECAQCGDRILSVNPRQAILCWSCNRMNEAETKNKHRRLDRMLESQYEAWRRILSSVASSQS